MTQQEIRLECLRLATLSKPPLQSEQPTIDQVIADAQRLERFVNGNQGDIKPLYFVRHADGSYSEADPQPTFTDHGDRSQLGDATC